MKTDIFDLVSIITEAIGGAFATVLGCVISIIGWIHSFVKGETVPEPKSVLITGATSGLGEGFARVYCKTCDKIIITGRNTEKLEKIKKDLKGINSKCEVVIYSADITSSAFKQWIEKIASTEKIDMVIANAGTILSTSGTEGDMMKYADMICDINIHGVYQTLIPFIAPMKARGCGQLVMVEGAMGNGVFGMDPIYEASKNNVRVFGLGMRNILLKSGIHMNIINPGYMYTNMTVDKKKSMPFCLYPEEVASRAKEQLIRDIPQINIPLPTYILTTSVGKVPMFGFSFAYEFLGFLSKKPKAE